MQLKKIPLSDTQSFSSFFLDYLQQKESLRPFYEAFPAPENFNKCLTKKEASFSAESRRILTESIQAQYASIDTAGPVGNNIQALAETKTFTITTGHQLNIFTGPLYFIYKIVTVINACKELKKKYPDYNFVPIYWMASEDHDYDEIKYFRLYGKKYSWETKQSGAVGRFKTTGLKELVKQIPGNTTPFEHAYSTFPKLSDAVRYYVHELFHSEGLVVVDGDDRTLKSSFKKVMQADIFEHRTIKQVEATNSKLEDLGYKTQIFCRDINFFYLDEKIRSRIEKNGDRFQVVDSPLSFSKAELQSIIDNEPEKLSPNVILRPLYQEIILPNIAYVGGPAEVIYWLQLKGIFDEHHVPFPLLMPRNFALIIDHVTQRKLEKTGLDLLTFFEPKNYIFNHWILRNTHHDLTVGHERKLLIETFEKIKSKAESVDKTLAPFVSAEGKRLVNALEKIEKKLLRAEKRLHSDKLRQIDQVKETLFPNEGLQERTDNFLNFYQRDPRFISKLLQLLDPFDFAFNVVTYPAND
jgi:bacillithiol synthase